MLLAFMTTSPPRHLPGEKGKRVWEGEGQLERTMVKVGVELAHIRPFAELNNFI